MNKTIKKILVGLVIALISSGVLFTATKSFVSYHVDKMIVNGVAEHFKMDTDEFETLVAITYELAENTQYEMISLVNNSIDEKDIDKNLKKIKSDSVKRTNIEQVCNSEIWLELSKEQVNGKLHLVNYVCTII